MVRRLITEAVTLAQDADADIGPASARWQYVWAVVRLDLRIALASLTEEYASDAQVGMPHEAKGCVGLCAVESGPG